MPELRDIFALVHRFHAYGVKLNIETKVEAGAPTETAPREQFVQVVAQEVRTARIARQVTIQSFDWGALMRMRQVAPDLPLVALTNYDFLQVGQPGKSPWLGGIDIDDFGGDLVKATKSFGASAISPVHGFPQDGKVTDPTYRPYVTADMVKSAHKAGMKVVPWTVDDPATMQSLIDKGVDGIITDYPDRLRDVVRAEGFKLPRSYDAPAVRALRVGSRAQRLRAPAAVAGRVGPWVQQCRGGRVARSTANCGSRMTWRTPYLGARWRACT